MKIVSAPESLMRCIIGLKSVMLSGNFVDSNLLGSGRRLSVDVNGGQYSKVFSVAHTDPYFTNDGISLSALELGAGVSLS